MKLYSWDIAPNPRRVRIYLAEKRIEVPVEEVGVPGKPILAPEFLARFGHRRVPLLELDDGTCIGEAMAICRYFEELHPEPPLIGRGPVERALVDMWERIAEAEAMHAAEFFRNSRKSFTDRALPGAEAAIPQIPELVERGRARMLMFYDKMDIELAGRDFFACDHFSVADITALCAIDFARFCELPIPTTCANLSGWYDRVSARPSAAA